MRKFPAWSQTRNAADSAVMQQRWIVWGVIVSIVAVLGLSGGYYAYKQYKLNRPSEMWVPLPFTNPEVTREQQKEVTADLDKRLREPGILAGVGRDLHLASIWNLSSEEAVTAELNRRMFCRLGKADTPQGQLSSVNIGFSGVVRENELLGKMSLRLMEDVWPILGLEPPPKQ